jgi:hypothetical protein
MIRYNSRRISSIMNSALKVMAATFLYLCLGASLRAQDDTFQAPDSVVLKDGTTVQGLIIKNTRFSVLIQQKNKELELPKSRIVRINDNADAGALNTEINKRGQLPSWRSIANDLRTNDAVKSLVEIPATVIDVGDFIDVPYKSFRVNDDVELNIYGDPENPAGVELGIYGRRSADKKLRKTLRGYLAGFLTTREEIAALYSLGLEKGIAQVGKLTLEITPKDAPDAYGAWWVSLYNKSALDEVRLSHAEYSRLVRPVNEVIDKQGRVISGGWSEKEARRSKKINQMGDEAKVLLRGFYRDRDGVFRLITDTQPSAGGET